MKTKIIYQDDHILVVHKPAGLATQAAGVGQPDVVSELKNFLKQPYLGVIHRLDQPVEGLLVFAKTKSAAASLTKQLAGGTLNKNYYALVCGNPSAESGTLVDYLVKDGNVARVENVPEQDIMKAEQSLVKQQEAKKAILHYRLIKSEADIYSLLDIEIETGRFHQIRCQLSHAGFPILGDRKYGTEKSMELGQKMGIRQLSLYAYHLKLKHPVTGKKLEFSIVPQCFEEILKMDFPKKQRVFL